MVCKSSSSTIIPEEKKVTLLDYALDTLNWLTRSFLKKNLPQNVHVETNTQSSTFW